MNSESLLTYDYITSSHIANTNEKTMKEFTTKYCKTLDKITTKSCNQIFKNNDIIHLVIQDTQLSNKNKKDLINCLSRYCNVNIIDRKGKTALMYTNDPELKQILINNGAIVDFQYTPQYASIISKRKKLKGRLSEKRYFDIIRDEQNEKEYQEWLTKRALRFKEKREADPVKLRKELDTDERKFYDKYLKEQATKEVNEKAAREAEEKDAREIERQMRLKQYNKSQQAQKEKEYGKWSRNLDKTWEDNRDIHPNMYRKEAHELAIEKYNKAFIAQQEQQRAAWLARLKGSSNTDPKPLDWESNALEWEKSNNTFV